MGNQAYKRYEKFIQHYFQQEFPQNCLPISLYLYLLCIRKIIYVTLYEITCQLKQPNRQKLKVKTIEGRALSIIE